MKRVFRWPSVLGVESLAKAVLVTRSENTLPAVVARSADADPASDPIEKARAEGILVECKSVSGEAKP